MLIESLVKYNLVTTFPSPQLTSSNFTFTNPSESQNSSLARQFSTTTRPHDTTKLSLVTKPLHEFEQFDVHGFNNSETLQRREFCRTRHYKQRPSKDVSKNTM